MFSKLSHIFTVLFLGIFFSVLFYTPAVKVENLITSKSSFLKKYQKAAQVLSVFSCYLLAGAFLFLIVAIFYSNIYSYFCNVSWEEFTDKSVNTVKSMFEMIPILANPELKNRCMDLFFSAMETGIQKILAYLGVLLMKLPKIIIKLVLGIIISIYLLIDRDNYMKSIRKIEKEYLSVRHRRTLCSIVRESKDMFYGYWKGQSLDALIMGICISIGLYVIGVPLGVPIGIFAGIGNLIPYVGPVIAFTCTVFFCVIEGKIKTLIIALIFLVVIQQADASYIGPKLLGKQVDLRPLTVVIAVLIGGTLFGAFGMIFAVPVTGIVKSIISILRKEQASYDKTKDIQGDLR